MFGKDKQPGQMSPPRLITIAFLLFITCGTALLALPAAAADGTPIGLLDALFTAVSAVCVNGLVVVDTGSAFSVFGQVVIMVLIQIGGLGFMTFGVMVAIMLGKKIGLKQRLIIQQTTQSTTSQGLVRLSLYMVLIAVTFEALSTVVLTLRWQEQMGLGQAMYYALFHSVSAFNNAGFALWSDSLSPFVGDPIVNMTIIALFVLGGLGYIVLVDIFRKRSWKRLSLHSKIVLLASGLISVTGFLFLFFLESWNPATYGRLDFGERLLASVFQGMTPRSAGFNTIDIGGMLAASQFLLIIWMFIGAASGGTGGGIKVNTVVVLVLATINTFRGRSHIHAFGRSISPGTVMRALAVVVSSLTCVMIVAMLLTVTEGLLERHFLEVLFEATSAFSTTGLSMGLTAELTPVGKAIVAVTMFVGRLGPLTLAFALAERKSGSRLRYPEDHVLIG